MNKQLTHRTLTRRARVAALGVMLCAVFSCLSARQTKENFEPINYSQEDIRRAEIKKIDSMLKHEPAKALWRAGLLLAAVDSGEGEAIAEEAHALVTRAKDAVRAEYDKAAEDKKYYEALRLFNALEAAGFAADTKTTRDSIVRLASENISALKTPPERKTAVSMPTSIRGTVTVWLDLGIKVERGMGYVNTGLGSGFFIGANGYIITNYHVIQSEVNPKYKGFSRLYVRLADDPDTKIPARVVGWDPLLDIALLKTEVDAPHIFKLGSSLDLDVGDRVYAIGSPVGLDRTLTSGIVSATERRLLTMGSVMQIDAAVNSGNSGGPLIDSFGNVQAIVFAGMQQFEGLNFAIPVEYLSIVLPALYAGGKLEHPWLGAYGHTFKSDVEGIEGVEVQYIMPGGSMAYTGIQAGDIVTAINGKAVKRLEDLHHELLTLPSDSIARVSGRTAGGKDFSYPVYLDPRPDFPAKEIYKRDMAAKYFIPIFGMELAAASASNKRQYSIKKIIRGGIADEAGFSENDPLEVLRTRLIESQEENQQSFFYAELYTKNRKNGYLDLGLAIRAPLDNPYYF